MSKQRYNYHTLDEFIPFIENTLKELEGLYTKEQIEDYITLLPIAISNLLYQGRTLNIPRFGRLQMKKYTTNYHSKKGILAVKGIFKRVRLIRWKKVKTLSDSCWLAYSHYNPTYKNMIDYNLLDGI